MEGGGSLPARWPNPSVRSYICICVFVYLCVCVFVYLYLCLWWIVLLLLLVRREGGGESLPARWPNPSVRLAGQWQAVGCGQANYRFEILERLRQLRGMSDPPYPPSYTLPSMQLTQVIIYLSLIRNDSSAFFTRWNQRWYRGALAPAISASWPISQNLSKLDFAQI